MNARETQRFWSKVQIVGECWVWIGSKWSSGYGMVYLYGDRHRAHVIAYEEFVGSVPFGLCVLHHCDNPPCVRPDHLFPGTRGDNMRDAAEKGRIAKGHVHWNAKLTEADVEEIRLLGQCGVFQRIIAQAYGIRQCNVSRILNNKWWRHVA